MNRLAWRSLEGFLRGRIAADPTGAVFAVTVGAVFPSSHRAQQDGVWAGGTAARGGVLVPTHMYAAMCNTSTGDSIGFMLPNDASAVGECSGNEAALNSMTFAKQNAMPVTVLEAKLSVALSKDSGGVEAARPEAAGRFATLLSLSSRFLTDRTTTAHVKLFPRERKERMWRCAKHLRLVSAYLLYRRRDVGSTTVVARCWFPPKQAEEAASIHAPEPRSQNGASPKIGLKKHKLKKKTHRNRHSPRL